MVLQDNTITYRRIIECYVEFGKKRCSDDLFIKYRPANWRIDYIYEHRGKVMFPMCLSEAYWVTV